jgi:hypothetical protein
MTTTITNPAAGNDYSVINVAWTFPTQENFGSNGIQNFHDITVTVNNVIIFTGAFSNGGVNDTLGYNKAYNYVVDAHYTLAGKTDGHRVETGSGVTGPAAPPTPASITASGGGSAGSINVSWGASTGASGYLLTRNGALVYNGSATSFADTGLTPGTTYSYAVQAYTTTAYGTAYSGTRSGSGTATAAPAPPSSAVSGYDGGGGYANVTWNFSSYATYGLSSVTIDGTTQPFSPASVGPTYTQQYVGYSRTVNWSATDNHGGGYSGTITTGAAPVTNPPSAPNPATNLVVTLNGASYNLTWTPSSGGASGYLIQRRYGTTTDNPLSTSGSSITDSSPPSTRPLTYAVYAYNSNSGGTTYAASSNVVTVSARVLDSVGILMG